MSIKRSLRYIGAFIALGIVAALVDWSALLAIISSASILYLILLIVLSVPLIGVSVIKWQLFLASFGCKPSLWQLSKLYLVGYFANLFLPSQFGGDVVRSASLGKEVGQLDAAVATFLERYTGVIAMVLLGLPGVVLLDNLTTEIRICYAVVFFALVCSTVALFTPFFWNTFHKRLPPRLNTKVEKVKKALLLIPHQPALIVKALVLSFVFHSLTVLNTVCAAYAIGWFEVPFFSLFVVLPLILLLAALPLTPNGLGIQEGAFYFFFTSLGASPEQALAVAVLLRAKAYILGACGGITLLLSSHKTTLSVPIRDKMYSEEL